MRNAAVRSPGMTDRILFLTGHLAENRLRRLLTGMGKTDFEWEVVNIGVKVAALMTESIILRRLPRPVRANRSAKSSCSADSTLTAKALPTW